VSESSDADTDPVAARKQGEHPLIKRSFLAELKRRNVIRAALLYVGGVWALAQGIAQLGPSVGAPEWITRWFLIAAAVGFPFWIAFAWFYEFTPDGLKRESEVESHESITRHTGRKLDFIIIAVMAVAIVLLLTDRFVLHHGVNATADVVVSEKSIAVLPFVNMSSDKEQEYFSDGISEDLLNLLAKIPELQVTARTSAFAFKGKETAVRDIAGQLHVAHLLIGSVRKVGNAVRISAQLVDAASDTQRWSQTWDRKLDDVFAIQDEIAAAVVNQLRITLLGAAPTAKPIDPKAYALILQAQELLNRAAWIAKVFDGKSSQYFGYLPRMRFTIKPVPPDLAPFYTSGRGGPGIYLLNTYDLPHRPLYNLPALTLHESAPGHAFQIPIALEHKNQPDFRRFDYISAYGEGWALYCEKLGQEMGMYETPYERFGMLGYQIWRAVRLVVDTGVHSKSWTREQALKYMNDYTALPEHEIQTEVDRYIAWPGQALSYYMGELAIVRAREKAEKTLGAKFNIRAFHDAVLELGSVPLPAVTARIDRFITEGGKGPYPDME